MYTHKAKETKNSSSNSGSTQQLISTLTPFSGTHNESFSQSMELPLENSKTWNLLVLYFLRTNQWECIPVFGTLMIGPREVVWSKPIGLKLLSLPRTVASTKKLVFGRMASRLVLMSRNKGPLARGCPRSLTQLLKKGWDGCRGTTWSIIIVQMRRDFLKVFQRSV